MPEYSVTTKNQKRPRAERSLAAQQPCPTPWREGKITRKQRYILAKFEKQRDLNRRTGGHRTIAARLIEEAKARKVLTESNRIKRMARGDGGGFKLGSIDDLQRLYDKSRRWEYTYGLENRHNRPYTNDYDRWWDSHEDTPISDLRSLGYVLKATYEDPIEL